jgi:hypothetical protein
VADPALLPRTTEALRAVIERRARELADCREETIRQAAEALAGEMYVSRGLSAAEEAANAPEGVPGPAGRERAAGAPRRALAG